MTVVVSVLEVPLELTWEGRPMDLHAGTVGRYRLRITTDPDDVDPDGWEASFDGGATWTAALVDDDDRLTWLVARADYRPELGTTEPDAVIAADQVPLLRHIDDPVVLSGPGPAIRLIGADLAAAP